MGAGNFTNPVTFQPLHKLFFALYRYATKLLQYRNIIAEPGNKGITAYPELCSSSADFIKKNQLGALKAFFVIRQFGYGDFDDFPAIHLLRTVPLSTLTRIVVEQIPFLGRFFNRPIAALAENGTQGLFRKVADRLKEQKDVVLPGQKAVLTGQEVKRIERISDAGPLVIHTTKDTHEVDKVICAVVNPKEQPEVEAILKKYLADNMCVKGYIYIPEHKFWPNCHPHVSLTEFQNGYFDKVEALQGKSTVYFTGDAMANESMEFSRRYSKKLIERFF